jgi:hypothetical protein
LKKLTELNFDKKRYHPTNTLSNANNACARTCSGGSPAAIKFNTVTNCVSI